MKLFSGSSNPPLTEKVARVLRIAVSPLNFFVFPDGERRVRVNDNVIEEDVVIVESTSTPVDQNYMELFFTIDGVKRSGAKSVSVVIPYLGYQRQDHVFRAGEEVSIEACIKLLHATGVDKVITFDLHTVKILELFDMFHLPITHISALPLFAHVIKEQKFDREETVLISPDMGGIRRIKELADLVKISYVVMVKERNLETGAITTTKFGTLESSYPMEEKMKLPKRVVIVDDMTSSGKTLVEAAKLAKKYGAEEIIGMVTHAIFSQDAVKLLQDSPFDKIYVTDTVFVPEGKLFPKLVVLSVAEIIALELRHKS